jgi:hypothetical protein
MVFEGERVGRKVKLLAVKGDGVERLPEGQVLPKLTRHLLLGLKLVIFFVWSLSVKRPLQKTRADKERAQYLLLTRN